PPQGQVPLRRELRVRADDDAARDPEIGGEDPGRRQLGAHRQALRADQVPDLPLDLQAERLPAVEPKSEQWSGLHGENWPFLEDQNEFYARPCWRPSFDSSPPFRSHSSRPERPARTPSTR